MLALIVATGAVLITTGALTRPLRRLSRATARSTLPLEILHVALVFFSGGPGLERAKVAALARLWILLAGIQPIFP